MKKVVFLPGDGIGQEVSAEAIKVLKAAAVKHKLDVDITAGLIGGASIEAHGTPMTDDVLQYCKHADAVFLGAIGAPQWDDLPFEQRPERALIKIRKELGVYANLRPVKSIEKLYDSSPLKNKLLVGVDMMIVRELTSGLYYGLPKERGTDEIGEYAVDAMFYRREEIERIVDLAFQIAQKRRKKLTSVDKSNVLLVSGLWRDIVVELSAKYPDVELNHLLVDNAAMQLIQNPSQFDVIVTENTFGDILSDEASVLTGSLGMLPSASIGSQVGLYEPVHGSAPDITGQGKANPLGAIQSIAMMLDHTFENKDAANAVVAAVEKSLNDGFTTFDIQTKGDTLLSTMEIGDKIVENILEG